MAESTEVAICFDHVYLAHHIAMTIKLKRFSFFLFFCVALWLIQTDLAYLIFQEISLLSIPLMSTFGKKRIEPSSVCQEILCCSYLMQSEVRLYLLLYTFNSPAGQKFKKLSDPIQHLFHPFTGCYQQGTRKVIQTDTTGFNPAPVAGAINPQTHLRLLQEEKFGQNPQLTKS